LPAAVPKRTDSALLKRLADDRVNRCLDQVQRAQDELDRACNELSALCHGAVLYKATQTLRERVHRHWYKVQAFRQRGKYVLDHTNVTAIEQKLAAKEMSHEQG
jgi:hypothetical protein